MKSQTKCEIPNCNKLTTKIKAEDEEIWAVYCKEHLEAYRAFSKKMDNDPEFKQNLDKMFKGN